MKKNILTLITVLAIVVGGFWYYTKYLTSYDFKGEIVLVESILAINKGTISAEGKFIRDSDKSTLSFDTKNKVRILYDEHTQIYREVETFPEASSLVRKDLLVKTEREVQQIGGLEMVKDFTALGGPSVINVVSNSNIYNRKTFQADEIHYLIQVLK